jgi:hypothetical protein
MKIKVHKHPIEEGSVVTNDGEPIGTITEGVCTLQKPVGPTVKGAIKKAAGLASLTFVASDAPGEPEDEAPLPDGINADGTIPQDEFEEEMKRQHARKSPTPSLAEMSDDELAAEMKRRGLIQEAPETPTVAQPPVIERDLSAVDRLHKLADEGKIPQPPEKHSAMGDKTPAYVAWFKQHATPAEMATRYPDNRRVPATVREFQQAAEKLQGRLPGEVKDTEKANDFANVKEGA